MTTPEASVRAEARRVIDTSIREVADLIDIRIDQNQSDYLSANIMSALTAAGFAVVRLPEPDRVDATGIAVWEVGDSNVYADPAASEPVINLP